MSDIADILGFAKKPVLSQSDEALKMLADQPKQQLKGLKKPKGMSREVFDLIGTETMTPVTQSNTLAPSFKNKRSSALKGKWIWDQIKNSARNDQTLKLYHWVKADVHYADYPYAKFNVKLDPLLITLEEYENYALVTSDWSFEDTVTVIDTCIKFDLRWPVIADRLKLDIPRKIEEVQARYFHVSSVIRQMRDGITEKVAFDLEAETSRRQQEDFLFRKTKNDEQEELKLREELKVIDLALKKYKKQVKSATTTASTNAVSKTNEGKLQAGKQIVSSEVVVAPAPPAPVASSTHNPTLVSEPQHPTEGKPCLQSTRLYVTDTGTGISKNLFRKMNAYLAEIGVPERPMATRAVCDMIDQIRLDTVTLLSLHNAINKREKASTSTGLVTSSTTVTVKTEKVPKVKSAAGTDGEGVKEKKSVKRKNAVVADGTTGIAGNTNGGEGSSKPNAKRKLVHEPVPTQN